MPPEGKLALRRRRRAAVPAQRGLWRERCAFSTACTCVYAVAVDPHDLWKTLWVTWAQRLQSCEFPGFGIGLPKNEAQKYCLKSNTYAMVTVM
jgi:putative component of membrane protein insertase Oxa1/YidC/SpoIIIJ protein YidD